MQLLILIIFFKPDSNESGKYFNTIGHCEFDFMPDSSEMNNWLPRPNYKLINNRLDTNEYVFGYVLGGELGNRSNHWYNICDDYVHWWKRESGQCFTSEVPPSIIEEAISFVRNEAPLKKTFLQVGTHNVSILDYTEDFRKI